MTAAQETDRLQRLVRAFRKFLIKEKLTAAETIGLLAMKLADFCRDVGWSRQQFLENLAEHWDMDEK